MNTTPTIKVTEDGPVVGVATARLLLQHAIDTEKQTASTEQSDMEQKRSVNDLTGASVHLPPNVSPDKQ